MDCRKWWDCPFSRRSGFLLAEALVVLLILSVAMGLAVPKLWDWQQERQLDLAAEEVAAAIRETETLAKSYTDWYGNITDKVNFHCGPDGDGVVSYYAKRGIYKVSPKGNLPSNITTNVVLDLTFRKDGYAGNSTKYTQTLQTRDGKHRRLITVAAYTGRVRIER